MSVSPTGQAIGSFTAWIAVQEEQQAEQAAATASAQIGAGVGGSAAQFQITPPPIGLDLYA
jgi:hypothetical protein